jgi:two-component system chemotaxis response regulator CheB
VTCAEAKDGDVIRPGHYYVAPGDFHMLITKRPEGPTVRLVKDPPENFCRPAVDPMLRSLVDVYGGRILIAILTGMGQDGTKGSEVAVHAGAAVIAQDEATSVVWGMPGAVAVAGLCSAVSPLGEIGPMVRQIATRGRV